MKDLFNLTVKSAFMRNILAKMIVKKTGRNLDLSIDNVRIESDDRRTTVKLELEITAENSELERILTDMGII